MKVNYSATIKLCGHIAKAFKDGCGTPLRAKQPIPCHVKYTWTDENNQSKLIYNQYIGLSYCTETKCSCRKKEAQLDTPLLECMSQ